MKHIGRQQYFGIGKESTRGTSVTATHWLPFTDFSVQQRVEKTTDNPAYGVIENSGDVETVRKYAQGDITALLSVDTAPLLFNNLLGSVSSSDNGDLTYTHTITVAQNPTHKSLTMVRKDDVNQFEFSMGMLESFSLDIDMDADDRVYADMSFTGKSSASNSDTPTFDASDTYFSPDTVSVFTADSGGGLDGGTEVPAQTVSLDVAPESLDREHTFKAGQDPADINNLGLSVEGSFTATFSDTTYESLAFNDTNKALRIQMKDTETTIGSASQNPEIKIDVERIEFTSEPEKSGGNDDVVTQEVTFEGRYDQSASKMITASVTNTESAY